MALQDALLNFFLLSVIPIIIIFSLERFFLHRLIIHPNGKAWVRSQFWLHPNFISRCRYPMGFVSVMLFHTGTILYPNDSLNIWHHIAIYWFGFWIISDLTDGTIARHFDLYTLEGESIDPFSDKLLLFPPLFYFVWLGLLPLYPVLIFLLFDAVGQFSRNFITKKSANLFGKAKTFLAVITIVLVTVQQVYYPGESWGVVLVTLLGAVFLGFCSVFFKIIPNYWYANILSILNFICGITGIVLVLKYDRIGMAFAAVFLGQFLDMFDGRAADRWGSTPRGELLDDLADGTNFGGTISFIIYAAFLAGTTGIILGVVHFLSTCYRLYRYLKEKRINGTEGGTEVFAGLPAPAAALLSGSSALINAPEYLKVIFIVLSGVLMVSRVSYIHFGRVILPAIPKFVRVVLLTVMITTIMVGFSTRNLQLIYWTVFACSLTYVIFGHPWRAIVAK